MKIHLACGRHVLDGWVNVDLVKHPSAKKDPELLGVNVDSLPFDDCSADEIMGIHIFEHFYQWEIPALLAEWSRVLKPNGKLILEMPDVVKAAKNLIKDPQNLQEAMYPLYGDCMLKDPLMCHKWGWTYQTIDPFLKDAGFSKMKECNPEWHGKRVHRDFRVEAIKC